MHKLQINAQNCLNLSKKSIFVAKYHKYHKRLLFLKSFQVILRFPTPPPLNTTPPQIYPQLNYYVITIVLN